MKALVLNGSENEESTVNTVSDYLVDSLRRDNHKVEVMVLRNEKIAPCLGCFGCWIKTPGKCVINDAGSELPAKIIQSDFVFLLTPVTFGMYSSQLKKALTDTRVHCCCPSSKKLTAKFTTQKDMINTPK
jgi:multimeric flavodoxin WrbA